MMTDIVHQPLFYYAASISSYIGFFSYTLAAILYAGTALALRFGWWGLPKNSLLWLACLITSLWSSSILLLSYHPQPTTLFLVQLLELARDGSWLITLARIIGFSHLNHKKRHNDDNQRQNRLMWSALMVALLLLAITLTQPFLPPHSPLLKLDQFMMLLGLTALSIFGIVFSEQILRNTFGHERWSVKFFCYALSALFIYDFLMYSHALLFKSIPSELWQARGVVNALLIPFLLIGASRNSARPRALSMSRRFVFRTGALIATSLYLIGIGTIGHYIKQMSGHWGALLQTLFIVSSFILLILLLFSDSIRAYFNIWLSQHFFRYRYDYRQEWMRFNNILTEIDSEHSVASRALTAVTHIVESTGGIIWYRDHDRHSGPETEKTTPSISKIHAHAIGSTHNFEHPFPDALIHFWQNRSDALQPSITDKRQHQPRREWVINLDEYHDTPSAYPDLELPEWLTSHPTLWLIIPLFLHDRLVGAIGLLRPRAPLALNWENYDLLKIAASQVCSHLAQEQATQALSKAKQFEAVNQATAFLIHDIKTMIAQLSLMVKNAERHKDNPAFIEDMISTTDHTVGKMTHMLEQLRRGHKEEQKQGKRKGQEKEEHCALLPTLTRVIAHHTQSTPIPTLATPQQIDETLHIAMSANTLTSALNHLIQNAKESTPPDGEITLTAEHLNDSEYITLTLTDSGCGMSPDFIRNRLFSPFESTKGLTGMGLGAYQSRAYIRDSGGDLSVESKVNHGTTFTVTLPIFNIHVNT